MDATILSCCDCLTQAGDCNVLICDETCDSLSPAVLAAILLVRYQVCREIFCMCCYCCLMGVVSDAANMYAIVLGWSLSPTCNKIVLLVASATVTCLL